MNTKKLLLIVFLSLLSIISLLGLSNGDNKIEETEVIDELVSNYTQAYETGDQQLLASLVLPEGTILISNQYQDQEANITEYSNMDDYLSTVRSNTGGVTVKEWNINNREISVEGNTAIARGSFYGYTTISESGYIESKGTITLHLSKVNGNWYIKSFKINDMVEDYAISIFMLTHVNQTLKYFGMK
ncbi:MAG: nuclear transport factor 2 family protein [Halanaerobiales bacterium]